MSRLERFNQFDLDSMIPIRLTRYDSIVCHRFILFHCGLTCSSWPPHLINSSHIAILHQLIKREHYQLIEAFEMWRCTFPKSAWFMQFILGKKNNKKKKKEEEEETKKRRKKRNLAFVLKQ